MSRSTTSPVDSSTAATDAYRMCIEYQLEDNQTFERQELLPADFRPAVRATYFDALCRERISEYLPNYDAAQITPKFPDPTEAANGIQGFSVRVPTSGQAWHSLEFPLRYFRSRADRRRAELGREERLTADQRLYFRVNAFLDDQTNPAPPPVFQLGPSICTLPVHPGARSDLGTSTPWDSPESEDLPVFIDRDVIEQGLEETRASPQQEVGGFLLGQTRRDPQSRELFLVVTGLVSSAGTTEASETSVTFTPDSFAHAQQMIRLRDAGESIVGWHHSHPFTFCAECPLPTPVECIAKVMFYSQDDVDLMSTTFEHPHMVGLLTGLEPKLEAALGHPPARLYGYRLGSIVERGFEVY